MSLEARVTTLESKFGALSDAVHKLINITAEIQKIMLENQRENRLRFQQIDQRLNQVDKRLDQMDKRLDQMDKRFEQVDQRIGRLESVVMALADATYAGFKRSDEQHAETREQMNQFHRETREQMNQFQSETKEQINKLELLILQRLPATQN